MAVKTEREILDSTPADTHMSRWWQQEGHVAKIAPMFQQKSYLIGTSKPLSKESTTLNSEDDVIIAHF